jgi:phosphate uptake regulator
VGGRHRHSLAHPLAGLRQAADLDRLGVEREQDPAPRRNDRSVARVAPSDPAVWRTPANLHLERIADQAVNLAKITCLAADLPQNPAVLGRLLEMGDLAVGMVDTAMQRWPAGTWGWRAGCRSWTIPSTS